MAKGTGKTSAVSKTSRTRGKSKSAIEDIDDEEELKRLIEKQQKKLDMLQSSIEELKEESTSKSASKASSKYFKTTNGKSAQTKVEKPKLEKVTRGTKRKSDENENSSGSLKLDGKKQKISKELASKAEPTETKKVSRRNSLSSKGKISKENKPGTSKTAENTKGKNSKPPKENILKKKPQEVKEKQSSSKKTALEKKGTPGHSKTKAMKQKATAGSSKKKLSTKEELPKPKPIELRPGATLEEEVTALLRAHENVPMSQIPHHDEMMSDDDDDDSDNDDWEEVEG